MQSTPVFEMSTPAAAADDDAVLLERFTATGDRAAIDAVVRRHVDFVYAAARRQLGGDAPAADDVTQAVFVLLARKASAVRPGRLGGWLFRTTRFCCANARKLTARRAHYERKAAATRPEQVMPHDPIAAAEDDQARMRPLLDDALASLSSADREAVILRYLQGRDMAAVCAALGVGDAAGRKRVQRAVERLRAFFANRGVTSLAAGAGPVVDLLARASAVRSPDAVTCAAVGAAATGAATAAAASVAKGAVGMLTWAKLKAAAAAVLVTTAVAGAGAEVARRVTARAGPPPPVVAPATGSVPTSPVAPNASATLSDATTAGQDVAPLPAEARAASPLQLRFVAATDGEGPATEMADPEREGAATFRVLDEVLVDGHDVAAIEPEQDGQRWRVAARLTPAGAARLRQALTAGGVGARRLAFLFDGQAVAGDVALAPGRTSLVLMPGGRRAEVDEAQARMVAYTMDVAVRAGRVPWPVGAIVPGESVGPIRIGMTDEELEEAMGPPARVPWADAPQARQYPLMGCSVLMTRGGGGAGGEPAVVAAITGGGAPPLGRAFTPRT
ncbi:MAG TPA: sigma-70 family RNA polymerase sigma factor, partial [Tepidisphaeraceae bacterium]|nr:sigma-70 family RNA polymerase sigma factor [Tepidisphaeraceae bacterium]